MYDHPQPRRNILGNKRARLSIKVLDQNPKSHQKVSQIMWCCKLMQMIKVSYNCSEGKDSDQGILDWLGVFPDVGVNMISLKYLTKRDTDAVSDVSDSSEEELTLEAREFFMIRLSDHATFQSPK